MKRAVRIDIPPRLWTAQEAGQRWETELDQLHRAYDASKRACVFRSPAEVKKTRHGFVRSGEGPPDFTGVVPGLAVLIEAKTCADDHGHFRLLLLKEHQAARMSAWESFDRRNVAMVLLFERTNEQRWILPWDDLRDRWERWNNDKAGRGEAHITSEQLSRIGIPFAPTIGWLPPLLAWAGQRGLVQT